MEVGIEDCLHIEFEYDKAKYHLKDSVIGKIYFLLVSKPDLVEIKGCCTRHQHVNVHARSEQPVLTESVRLLSRALAPENFAGHTALICP